MTAASRKEKRNLGGEVAATVTPFFKGPALAESRTNVVMIERVLLAVLRSEVDRLAKDEAEATRFFSHFFDPLAGVKERKAFVENFRKQPPTVVLGYPRVTAEFPVFAVILESEQETDETVGDYLGQTLPDEIVSEPAEYEGAVWEHTYGIYIYAENPDVCVYLYQFAKMVLFGAKLALTQSGLIDPSFSGGELSPEEMYVPEHMYSRVLRVTAKAVMSVPALLSVDPARVRLGGLFLDDVVVGGVRGGVHPIPRREECADDDGADD